MPTASESEIDSRTSRTRSRSRCAPARPIYVDERVLDEAGVEPDQRGRRGRPSEEKLAVFRDFVNSLDVDLESGDTEHREEQP